MVELIWDGKYDTDGNRVAPLRVKLPFQTVETVSESAQQRQMSLDFGGRQTEWRNRLIWGDKKYVLPSLLDEFAGKVDLIYIDPPFATGADFSLQISINGEEFTKEPSMIEEKAYRDTWGKDFDTYAKWFYDAAILFHNLLSETGSIFVQCDWRLNSIIRIILDEVFSLDNYRNEIVWRRTFAGKTITRNIPQNADFILWYSKTARYKFSPMTREFNEKDIEAFNKDDGDGRGLYTTVSLQKVSGPTPGTAYKYIDNEGRKWPHPPKGWRMVESKLKALENDGRLYITDKTIREKYYLNERLEKGKQVDNVWSDIGNLNRSRGEILGYPTQKPEALLDRIVAASTDEGDLVLDCFVGSGTTAAVAEKLGRRWIACDLGRFAVHTTRKRLLSITDVKPFVVQNLGKYERQTWQSAEFGSKKRAEALQKDYRNFLLELYSARPIEGYAWLHGIKGGRMVHVGSVDSPVALGDITQIAIEFKKAIGTGKDAPKEAAVDVLGWDFAFEINEVGIQQARDAGINLRCLKIPREVMDPKAVEQGDVKFFELAALAVDAKVKKSEMFLELKDFTIPPDDVPDDVQKAIKHWSQWIDYWAVDWDNKADTFHNQWQTYRTRQEPSLKLKTSHVYEEPGSYTVMVKVIDILGNDTTKVIKVSI
ncbi:MAG: hypothetical protein KF701_05665 [Anaerolineales bacterium]|nr:MAG: hypothetical protein KF701_05665 [Anaerolineales bacterium]